MTVRDIVYIQLRRVHVKRFSVKNYVCLSFGCHQFRNTITFQGHAQQVNNKPGTQFSAFESFFGSFVFKSQIWSRLDVYEIFYNAHHLERLE